MTVSLIPLFTDAQLSASQDVAVLRLPFVLTAGSGVNTAAYVEPTAPGVLIEGGTGSALTTITQASVDALLGVANDVIVSAAFGTTAMIDNDTYAFVLACNGQIKKGVFARSTLSIAGTITTQLAVPTTTALTNVSFAGTQIYITPAGNIAGRIDLTNISAAATAGYIDLAITVRLK